MAIAALYYTTSTITVAIFFQMDIGMVEFVGLIKVDIIRGTDLAVRDVMSSDPYVMIILGHQVSTFHWLIWQLSYANMFLHPINSFIILVHENKGDKEHPEPYMEWKINAINPSPGAAS